MIQHVRSNTIDPLAVSIDDACRMIGVGRSAVYELINSGRIVSTKIGYRRVVSVASLKALFAEGASDS